MAEIADTIPLHAMTASAPPEPMLPGNLRWHAMLAGVFVVAGNVQRRFLALVIGLLGPKPAYALMAVLARRFYRLADEVRAHGEGRCRAAFGGCPTPPGWATDDSRGAPIKPSEPEIQAIARQAFVHRMWNLVDLTLAPRLLRPATFGRYGGRIAESDLTPLIEAQRRRQPVILLTAYYGPYDLLPVFLGLNGIRSTAVYRPHPNRAFDRFRQSVRGRAGCRMLTDSGAASALADALERGETVALLADHAAGRSGVPVPFLGLSTTAPRTVGLLAERYGAIVAATAIRRQCEPFHFQLVVSDLFGPDAWRDEADAIAYITHRYTAALDRVIREQPEQYLWLHRRDSLSEPEARAPGPRTRGCASTSSPSPGRDT